MPSLRPPGAHLLESPSQQRRRDERGGEDDQQQRGVLVAIEDRLAQPDGREDQADLTARDHAQADEALVPRRPGRADSGDDLPDQGHGEQAGADGEHRRVEERLDPGVDADLEEEHGDEEVADGCELAGDAVGDGAA